MLYLALILILLLLVNILLCYFIYDKIKHYKHVDDKDKEFIIFVIDMYVEYAHDLKIHSSEQHDKIVEQLNKIKNKYFS
jgi:competence protein ComGC